MKHKLRKFYWLITSKYTAWKNPIDKNLIYFGITGTDGKTTTSSFLYEIAKANGYKPLLLTTVSAKFEDKIINTELKSSSFLSYSIKNTLSGLAHFNLKKVFKNIFFQDKEGFEKNTEQHRTTPLAGEIRRIINEYTKKGADFFILETTSHSLDQYRVYGIEYDAAIYTNITNEHLDYHGSWEEYAKTKAKLLLQLKPNGVVAINKDDKKSYEFLSNVLEKNFSHITKVVYSTKDLKKISLKKFLISAEEISEKDIKIIARPNTKAPHKDAETSLEIFGDYNIYNALGAISGFYGFVNTPVGNRHACSLQEISGAVRNLKNITGRMEFISEKPTIIVDFAHTPNAMEKALISARKLVNKNGRLWVIFGCAGLRDNFKRPTMGKIAYDNADNIMITSEDPRTEDLHKINDQIIDGFKNSDDQFIIESYYPELEYNPAKSKYIVRFDEPNPNSRKSAIDFAVKNAKEEDLIIVLGKAHETSICFGTKEWEWNDIEEVKKSIG